MSSSALLGSHFNNFSDFLASTLRVGTNLRVYHVSTPPTPTTPIYSSLADRQASPTTCESHFLAISQPNVNGFEDIPAGIPVTSVAADAKFDDHVLVLGIEVLIFTTDTLATIFVSKADSTGFLSRPSHSIQGSSSIIRAVITAFLGWLVSRNLSSRTPETSNVTRHEPAPPKTENEIPNSIKEASVSDPTPRKQKLVLSLFARSQNQYLFPGSVENATKHVLDDRQLIKWWCRVLDGVVKRDWPVEEYFNTAITPSVSDAHVTVNANAHSASTQPQHVASASASASTPVTATANVSPQAYIIVPGCDRAETIRSFFPPSARYSGAASRWHNSYPDQHLAGTDIRQVGDDTSAVVPVRCMIPRLPDDPKARYCDDLDQAGIDDKGRWRDIKTLQQFWETMEYRQECAAGRLVGFIWVAFDTSCLMPASAIGNTTITSDKLAPSEQNEYSTAGSGVFAATDDRTVLAASSRVAPASIVLSADQYNTLADFLINHTDFAGIELAKKSTEEWIAKVKELSGSRLFGADIEGQAAATPSAPREDSGVSMQSALATLGEKHGRDDANEPRVNLLTGIRKKRKVEQEPSTQSSVHVANGSVGVEGGETGAVPATAGPTSDGVTTLSAGLVRKKPKVSNN